MIGVWRVEDKIKVICSSKSVSVNTVKIVIRDIRRITSKSNSKCFIEIKSFDKINFTGRGSLFFDRLVSSKALNNAVMNIEFTN